MKKTEDIKALAPLIAQYEEDSDSQPSLGTINCMPLFSLLLIIDQLLIHYYYSDGSRR